MNRQIHADVLEYKEAVRDISMGPVSQMALCHKGQGVRSMHWWLYASSCLGLASSGQVGRSVMGKAWLTQGPWQIKMEVTGMIRYAKND